MSRFDTKQSNGLAGRGEGVCNNCYSDIVIYQIVGIIIFIGVPVGAVGAFVYHFPLVAVLLALSVFAFFFWRWGR